MKKITKKKIAFVDLIEPYYDGSNIGFKFEMLRWFIKTGNKYKGVKELLSKQPTCINSEWMKPINSCDLIENSVHREIKRRFEFALLTQGTKEVTKWREKFNISINNKKIITGLKWHEDRGSIVVEELFNEIFSVPSKRKFKKSPNPYHNARAIKSVEFVIKPTNYIFRIEYSLKSDDSYHWYFDVYSEEGEYFYDYLKRLKKIIDKETEKV